MDRETISHRPDITDDNTSDAVDPSAHNIDHHRSSQQQIPGFHWLNNNYPEEETKEEG